MNADEIQSAEGNLTVGSVVEQVVSGMNPAEWTPYQVHTVVNRTLAALGSDYRVSPQMMYNYDRNGMVVKGSKSKLRFTSDEVISFAVRFVERNRNR